MNQSKEELRRLTLTGILAALVFVVTSFTKIPLPFFYTKEAYFHAGDSIIFMASLLVGPWAAGVAAGLGSFLADLYLGAPHYMLASFFIKGGMGFIAGLFLYGQVKPSVIRQSLGLVLAGLWMTLGYYVFEVVFFQINWIVNLSTLPVNFAQALLGMVIYLPLSKVIMKAVKPI